MALCGGVGGAKLAYGLSQLLSTDELTIAVNTGDDFEHLGYKICPDIDTVIYNLAEINNMELGWGIQGETWEFMQQLKREDPDNSWFQLGDKDLRTHKLRKQHLSSGLNLTETTREICTAYRVKHSVIPMTDDIVSTTVNTPDGALPFQHYFVKYQCEPVVTGFEFEGSQQANTNPIFLSALEDPTLSAVVICPSNPYVSIDPIINLPNIKKKLGDLNIPVIAVSPIIGGTAIKGPTGKMMKELNIPCTNSAIAEHYQEIINHLIIDHTDLPEKTAIEKFNIQCSATNTLMKSKQDKINLAQYLLDLIS